MCDRCCRSLATLWMLSAIISLAGCAEQGPSAKDLVPIVMEVQTKVEAARISDLEIRNNSCKVMEHGQSYSCIVAFDFVVGSINLANARTMELIVKKFEDEWRLIAAFDVEPK